MDALWPLNRISEDPLIEMPRHDDSLLSEVVRGDRRTLNLIASLDPETPGSCCREDGVGIDSEHVPQSTEGCSRYQEVPIRETHRCLRLLVPGQRQSLDEQLSAECAR